MPRFFAARVLFGPQGAQEMAAMPNWSPSVDIVETPEEYLTSPFKVAARPHPPLPCAPSPDGERGSLPVFKRFSTCRRTKPPLPVGRGGARKWRVRSRERLFLSASGTLKGVEYLTKAELPEVKKDDVKLSVSDGVLRLSGERKQEKEEKGKKYHRVERFYGSFLRSFTLPDNVDAAKVRAEFKDGMLTVHLARTAALAPKTTDIRIT